MGNYLSLLFTFRDVEAQYRKDKNEKHPFYLDQLLVSKVLRLVGSILTIGFGISLSQGSIDNLTQALPAGISAAIAIYGEVMNIVVQLRDKNKQIQAQQNAANPQ